MLNFLLPVLLVVLSNIFYHISSKSMPSGANPFAVLIVVYLIGALSSAALYFLGSGDKNILAEFKNLNWTSLVLGFSIVGLEAGYIYMYRVGWNISVGSLVANILLAVALIAVGLLIFKEQVSVNKLIGIGLCIAGLIFINRG